MLHLELGIVPPPPANGSEDEIISDSVHITRQCIVTSFCHAVYGKLTLVQCLEYDKDGYKKADSLLYYRFLVLQDSGSFCPVV